MCIYRRLGGDNLEIVSFRFVRSCVRARGLVVEWKSGSNGVRVLSLFPFRPGSFLFSLESPPLPPTSYPALAGLIGIYIYIYNWARIPRGTFVYTAPPWEEHPSLGVVLVPYSRVGVIMLFTDAFLMDFRSPGGEKGPLGSPTSLEGLLVKILPQYYQTWSSPGAGRTCNAYTYNCVS